MPRDLRIWLGGGFILALILIAIFAPLLAPFDPLEQDLMAATAPPIASICASSARAPSFNASTLRSIAGLPSNRSSYSSRSVS